MKILLINNHTVHMNSLGKALAGHQVEVQTYHPGIEFNYHDKDLIILSGGGGEGLEIHDYHDSGQLWYEDEMKLVRTADKPILGICMGFEVMARAYGAPVTPVGGRVLNREDRKLTKEGQSRFGDRFINQYEAHSWRVEDVPSDFEVWAKSKKGIEMFLYKDKLGDRWGSQFHPEKGGTLTLPNLLRTLTI